MRWTQRGSFRCRIGIWIRVCVFLMFAENALFHIWDFYLLVSSRSKRKRLHNIDFDVYLIRIFFAMGICHINIRSINSKKKLSEANTCAQTCSVETKRIHSAFFSSSLHTLPFLCVFFCSVYSGFVKIPSKEQTTRMFSVARIQYVSERAARRIGNYEHDISFNY